MHTVFVYGTLRDEYESGREAILNGARKDASGRYPTLVPDESGQVNGELITVNDQELQDLDNYENVPQLYHRIRIDGVWVYIGNPDLLGSDADYRYNRDAITESFQHTEINTVGR